ncbi:unnamed protein product, partial [Nesidiocoris tenuis]
MICIAFLPKWPYALVEPGNRSIPSLLIRNLKRFLGYFRALRPYQWAKVNQWGTHISLWSKLEKAPTSLSHIRQTSASSWAAPLIK